MNNNNNTILLFDNIKGEILEFTKDVEIETITLKHQEYEDDYVIFGKDYFNGHNVWFIKGIQDDTLTRLTLEERVLDYFARKK